MEGFHRDLGGAAALMGSACTVALADTVGPSKHSFTKDAVGLAHRSRGLLVGIGGSVRYRSSIAFVVCRRRKRLAALGRLPLSDSHSLMFDSGMPAANASSQRVVNPD